MAGIIILLCFLAILQSNALNRIDLNFSRHPDNKCKAAKSDCDFLMEDGRPINCVIESDSRRMYAKWIPDTAKVLEVGARYGQTTCALAKHLVTGGKGTLISVEADARVWSVLEENLQRKGCVPTQLIKGIIGPKDLKMVHEGKYGTATGEALIEGEGNPVENHVLKKEYSPKHGSDGPMTPHHTFELLDTAIDTLAIDCEGCFASFLHENPSIMQSLNMIIAEVHNGKEFAEVQRLLLQGWTLKDQVGVGPAQKVLCKGSCTVADPTC